MLLSRMNFIPTFFLLNVIRERRYKQTLVNYKLPKYIQEPVPILSELTTVPNDSIQGVLFGSVCVFGMYLSTLSNIQELSLT